MYTELGEPRYLSLTTRRRDGSFVSTPVWVVSDDGKRLLVWTGASTWKVKRIRRDPHVLVAACSMRGHERGRRLEGVARILGVEGAELLLPLLRRKYGWQRRLLEVQASMQRRLGKAVEAPHAYIEIVASPPAA
jgi:uncharacterized protein